MLALNKFLLYINMALVVINVWQHKPGWALLAALCIWCNLSVIRQLENKNDGMGRS